MVSVLRWLLVIAAPILGWYIALVAGLLLLDFTESWCPPEEMISGMCTAAWFPLASNAVFCFSTALAAVLVVAGAVLAAPSRRRQVAWTAFALGSVVALALAAAAVAWAEFASAVLAGGLTAFLLARRA